MNSSATDAKRVGSRLTWIAILALAALFTYFVVYHWHHESKDEGGHLGDFHTFYQAGEFALHDRDISDAGPNRAQM